MRCFPCGGQSFSHGGNRRELPKVVREQYTCPSPRSVSSKCCKIWQCCYWRWYEGLQLVLQCRRVMDGCETPLWCICRWLWVSVLMFVYIEVASAVKRRVVCERQSSANITLSSNESLKKVGCFRARGWRAWSTHLPRLWGWLVTSDVTERVGHWPLVFCGLWIL